MKKLLSLCLLFVMTAIAARGQTPTGYFTPVTDKKPYAAVFYVTFVDGEGNEMVPKGDDIAAFVGDECRIVKNTEYEYVEPADAQVTTLRVGGESSDNGKAITLHYYTEGGLEYIVKPADGGTFSFNGDQTFGKPSNPIKLVYQPVTEIFISDNDELDESAYSTWTIGVGEEVAIPLKFAPANHSEIVNYRVEYVLQSDTPSNVGIVDNDKGTIKGTTPGTGSLQAELFNTKTDAIAMTHNGRPIQVVQYVTGIEKVKDIVLEVGQVDLVSEYYKLLPEGATTGLVYSIADTGIAAIQTSAAAGTQIKGVATGTTTLRVATGDGKYSVEIPVTVRVSASGLDYPAGISRDLTVNVGTDLIPLMPYVINPSDATIQTVSYTSGNANVVRVGDDGSVTAVGVGKTTVTISHEEVPESLLVYNVTVENAVTGITAVSTKTIMTGKEYIVSEGDEWYQILPANATNREVTLEVVGENSDGFDPYIGQNDEWTIVATVAGTYTLKITSVADNTKSATITIIVKQALESLSFEDMELEIGLDKPSDLPSVTAYPDDAEFDASKVVFTVPSQTGSLPDGWTGLTVSGDKLIGRYPGSYTLQASYEIGDGEEPVTANITVNVLPQTSLASGWNWISFIDDPIASTGSPDRFDLLQIWQDNGSLVEVRSEDQLAYNDEQVGLFGDLTSLTGGEAYKIKLTEAYTANYGYGTYSRKFSVAQNKSLDAGWNWIAYPYIYAYAVNDVVKGSGFQDGDRILAQNAQAVYDGTSKKWTGSLAEFTPGQAYIVYSKNAGSMGWTNYETLSQPDEGVVVTPDPNKSPARRARRNTMPAFDYNEHQFANTMNIIARADGDMAVNPDNYELAAFVGEECRGEGIYVDGLWFVTLGGETGDNVSLRLYNRTTGEYSQLPATMAYTSLLGDLRRPVELRTGNTTAISDISIDGADSNAKVYDLSGRLVQQYVNLKQLPKGIYVVKTATTSRKVTVK